MARDENETSPVRVFSLFEANQLIPQLQLHLSTVREGKTVLMRTREERRIQRVIEILTRMSPEGRDAVLSSLAELKEAVQSDEC